MQPVSPQGRPVTPQTPVYSPPWVGAGGGPGGNQFGSPGTGTSGGLVTGGGFRQGGGHGLPPAPVEQHNPQQFQGMANQFWAQHQQQLQAMLQQHPGWAGYLQWLQSMHRPPQMPGRGPGPTRG